MQAARESVTKQRKFWQAARQKALEKIKEEGVEVIRPPKEPFRESVQSVYTYFKENNPKVYDIAQQIKNVEVDTSENSKNDTIK